MRYILSVNVEKSVAHQAITQIQTVYAFAGETKALKAYTNALQRLLKLGKIGALARGLGVGCTYGLLFAAWALLLWYASILVMHKVTNGAEAFTSILSVIISGMYATVSLSSPSKFCF